MTRTRPNERVDTQARVIEALATDVTRALEHIQREIAQMDWHKGGSSDDSGVRVKGGEPSSPTEVAAIQRYEFTSRREDIRDWITGLEEYTRSGRYLVDEALKMRTAHTELFDATDYGKRCKHPTCEQWASEHLLPLVDPYASGAKVDDWCDAHWLDACQIHGNHGHEGRRVQGVLCCQKAYRDHQRETLKETA